MTKSCVPGPEAAGKRRRHGPAAERLRKCQELTVTELYDLYLRIGVEHKKALTVSACLSNGSSSKTVGALGMIAEADAAIDSFAAGRRVDAARLSPELAPLFGADLQRFLISLFSIEPATLAAASNKPILIVQGMRDLQVSVKDADVLSKAAKTGTLMLVPDMNHVLKRVASADPAENVAT